jgi:uncharacterized membrane protein|tara:strand:- start:1632 stop:3104 length:1473 start_codon:yes stop_codon:yes gene_type:complete
LNAFHKLINKDLKHNFSFSLLILIAGVMRFNGLTRQSYWWDEVLKFSLSAPQNDLYAVIKQTLDAAHPFAWNVLLWGWVKIIGYTEFSGRSMSAILGTIGIICVYFLGKELVDKQTGIYASLIASLNAFLIQFSQDTTSYSLLFLMTTISYLFFFKVIKKAKVCYEIIPYIIFSIILCYTHYYGFMIIFTQFINILIYLYMKPDNRKIITSLFLTAFLVITIFLFPLVTYLKEVIFSDGFNWIPKPNLIFFIYLIHSYTKVIVLDIMYVILLSYGIYSIIRNLKQNDQVYPMIALVAWLFAGYVFPLLYSLLVSPVLIQRATIIQMPAIVVLIAIGISSVPIKYVRSILLSIIVIFSFHAYKKYFFVPQKEQMREVLYTVYDRSESIPIYDVWYRREYLLDDKLHNDESLFTLYAKILDLDIKILPFDLLEEQYVSNNMPNKFWVIETHKDKMLSAQILHNNLVSKIKDYRFLAAQAVLFSYEPSPPVSG